MMVEVSDSKQGSVKYIHTQSRVSSQIAEKWREDLDKTELEKMNSVCKKAIGLHETLSMF